MSRKINFGDFEEDSQESKKEPQIEKLESQDLSLEVEEKDLEIDRLNTAIDNLQTRLEVQASEYQSERMQIQETIDSLNYQLKLRNQDITQFQTVVQKQTIQIQNLSNEILELKKVKGSKPVKSGLKTKIDETKIADMRDYALSLNDKQHFYRKIKEKFNVSVGSAHNYTKDIYESKFKGERSND